MTDAQKKVLAGIRQAFAEGRNAGFKSDEEAFEAYKATKESPRDHAVDWLTNQPVERVRPDNPINEQSGGELALSGGDADKPKK